MSSIRSDEEQEEINVDTDSRLSGGCDQSDRESDRERPGSYSPRMSPDLHRNHTISHQTHPSQISLPFSISRLLGKSFDDEKIANVGRRGVDDFIDRIQRRDSNEDTTDEEGRMRSDNEHDNESDGARDDYRRSLSSVGNDGDDVARDEYRKLRESAGGCFMGGGGVGYGVAGLYGSGGGVLRVPAQRALGALGALPWGLPLDPRHAAAAAFAHQVVKDRLNGE